MTKVYVMASCPDCSEIKARLSGNPDFEIIDIGEHVRNLKEFIRLRDSSPEFESIKAIGSIGIPCFAEDDGSISFDVRKYIADDFSTGNSCSIDGKGC